MITYFLKLRLILKKKETKHKLLFFCMNIVVDKKMPHLLELFLPWSYLCEFLIPKWKIGIIGEMLDFVMMCLVFSYSHPFEIYWCVSENGTLCSQSRLIHFDSSNIQKIFIFENFNKVNIFTKKNFSNPFGYVCDLIIWNEVWFFFELKITLYR